MTDEDDLLTRIYGNRGPYHDPSLDVGDRSTAFPTLPPLPPRAELRAPGPRPADPMQPLYENLSPTMGAYGAGNLLAETYGKAREGNWSGVADRLPMMAGMAIPGTRRTALKAEAGKPQVWYHKTNQDFDVSGFSPFSHFGSSEQANMRAVGADARVIPVHLSDDINFVRQRDTGSWNQKKLEDLATKGYGGVKYLNRYEGIPLEAFERAAAKVGGHDRLDALSDAQFKKLIPEAQESVVVFDPRKIRSALSDEPRSPIQTQK